MVYILMAVFLSERVPPYSSFVFSKLESPLALAKLGRNLAKGDVLTESKIFQQP